MATSAELHAASAAARSNAVRRFGRAEFRIPELSWNKRIFTDK
jgi:hypothetical protein